MIVSYDGTAYCGWQIQKKGVTIQGLLEDALYKITEEKIKVVGSGRTDAGVHAEGQVCHFDTIKTNIPPEKYKFCINNLLPCDIRILKSELASDDFHARYTAKQKTYIYNMYISDTILPLKDKYSLRVDKVNIDIMKDCAKLFLGEHDFAAFCSTGSSVISTKRKIFDIFIENCENDIKLLVTGDGFLYNMVRIISGTLLLAAQQKICKEDIEKALKNGDRKLAGKTLAAKALVLKNVEYSLKI